MRSRYLFAFLVPALLALSACTPPVPPEVKAFRDELNVPCGSGDITISRPLVYSDFIDSYMENFNNACPDVTVHVVDPGESADVVIAEPASMKAQLASTGCTAKIDTPIAYDGSAIVYSQSNISELLLSPHSLSDLLNGQFATWDSPALVADNPDGGFPSDSFNVLSSNDLSSVRALNAWGEILDGPRWSPIMSDADVVIAEPNWDADTASNDLSEENVVGVTPLSFALNNSLYVAAIKTEQFDSPTYADIDSLTAGASQMRLDSTTSLILTPTYDSERAVTPPLGADKPNQPWGAVYAVRGVMCESTTNAETAQSFLRYGVRADQQNGLSSYNLAPIPEDVRLKLATKLNQGLHIPTDVPIPE